MSVLRIMNFNCDLRNSEPIFKKKRKISIEKKKNERKGGALMEAGRAAQRRAARGLYLLCLPGEWGGDR